MSDLVEIVAQVELDAAEPYLRARGWELVREGELGNRWRLRADHEIRNVAVPNITLDEDDREKMLLGVLQTLAEIERRDPVLIGRDLRDASSDLLEFRVIANELAHGELPLRAAPDVTGGAFEAMQAAARAEVGRRPHYPAGALPARARSFIDAAKLAGTSRGSVILQVRTPAPEEERQPTIGGLPAEAPFERRVVVRLIGGVRGAKAATHRDLAAPDIDAFDEDVEEGLSANLCDALLRLSGEQSGLDARVGIRVRWALTRPTDEAATVVEVDRGELGRLPEVATILKEIEPSPDTRVVGPVTRLSRQPGEEVGSVWIQADIEGKARTVRMQLERSDYDRAMYAHRLELELEARGTLERAGHARELTDPTRVQIAGTSDSIRP